MKDRLYYYGSLVQRIKDADTLVIHHIDYGFNISSSSEEVVRVFGINAYETKLNKRRGIGPAHKAKGIKAKKYVEEMIPCGTEIIIQTIKLPGVPLRDVFGRILANVFYPAISMEVNGGEDIWINLGEDLLKKRYAVKYKKGQKW